MSKKVFDYNRITKIGIEGPSSLLEKIAENLESEVTHNTGVDCLIRINITKHPVEIIKDKRFDYLTVTKTRTEDQQTISYKRYNTYVRTIRKKSPTLYEVDVNINLDEASGLICIRNYLNNHPLLSQYPLLHASLLNLNGIGVLIPGFYKRGKTTLSVYLLQEQKANFVSDENVILESSDDGIRGLYVPRTIRVRFSTIAESKLSKVLENITIANATQYIDQDAIERIIKARKFNVDAGIAFSRKAFCNLLGTNSQESSSIDLVIFPNYSESMKIRKIDSQLGIERLSSFGLIRKSKISPRELEQAKIDLSQYNFRRIDFLEVGFSSMESLKQMSFRI